MFLASMKHMIHFNSQFMIFFVLCVVKDKKRLKRERKEITCWVAKNPKSWPEYNNTWPVSSSGTEQTGWARRSKTLQLCDGACPALNASTLSGSATVSLRFPSSDRILWFYIFDFLSIHKLQLQNCSSSATKLWTWLRFDQSYNQSLLFGIVLFDFVVYGLVID